jgi:mycobactin lysine-N-oxygenase
MRKKAPNTASPPEKHIVVVGAGPKAAALAAKARVLDKLKLGSKVRLTIIERSDLAANWSGTSGFTDGDCSLGTPPEKDVGFPYNSVYGNEVNKAMLEYSWQAFKILNTVPLYSDWIDRGRLQPTHKEWSRYIAWVLQICESERVKIWRGWEVIGLEPTEKGTLIIAAKRISGGKIERIEADGVVFTGPGEPLQLEKVHAEPKNRIFDGRSYWWNISHFRDMSKKTKGRIALVGAGETAASIALSLLEITNAHDGPVLEIDIINRQGTIFTRGESYNENRLFSDPKPWKRLHETIRDEIIRRTDRGVFSMAAQTKLNQSERMTIIPGRVISLDDAGHKIEVHLLRGDPPVTEVKYKYDKVILALGFDPWGPLQMFPDEFRPTAERLQLQRDIDEYLRLPFDSVPKLADNKPNVHTPMLAGLKQGPGFPNLSCLGHTADRILSLYIPPP